MRFAKVEINELTGITSNGVITLKIYEPVQLVNEWKYINPDMLDLDFIKNSDQAVSMTGFDLIKYEETEI